MFYRPAADGRIIIIEIAVVDLEFLKKIVDAHIAVHLIEVIGQLNNLILYDIAFIPDIADELFEDILHSNEAHGSAVFIGDYGKMELLFAELAQRLRKDRGLMNVAYGKEVAPYIERSALAHGL